MGTRLRAFGHETLSAENRLATLLDWARLEWNLTLCTTLGAGSVEHLTVGHALTLARITTILTTLWSAEVLGGVKLLFTFCERKRLTAIAAL
ncbi:MAG: hypothetical protein JWM56_1211 [Candidatus Peribacteria bacterium]|nr:hypothetical protein [Candidatus Peribacteria bacterium]